MEASADSHRTAALHHRLIDEIDPLRRARVHLELATIALRSGQVEPAARHFREALALDNSLEHARNGLHALGTTATTPKARPKGLSGWWARMRGK